MANCDVCENCGFAELEIFHVADSHKMRYCPECLLYQKGVLPDIKVYEEGYHVDYTSRKFSKVLTGMIRLGAVTKYMSSSQLKQPDLKLLDIGCSIGATVEAGNRIGWNSTGVDISRSAVAACTSRGLNCQTIDDHQLPFEDGVFDIVSSWHVIEHVPDVRQTLDEWIRVVKPGGFLILETPDSQFLKAKRLGAKYRKFWPPEHLYTFTRSNMCSLLEQTGFEVLPSPVLGKLSALPVHLQAYAFAYRMLRKTYRKLGICKSIEVICRKPSQTQSTQRSKAA